MAFFDQLTGLTNRTLFKETLQKAIESASAFDKKIGVLFIDLDGFKAVNDSMGHGCGDILIQQVAMTLRQFGQTARSIARFGGDEFLIMLEDVVHENEIIVVAEKIMSHFRCPFSLAGHEYFITISMGIAIYPQDSDNAEALIQNSDLAMYKAKSQGKNQYMLFNAELKEEMRLKARLSNGLYWALERHELNLYYQPQIDLQTGQIIGLEALLRWNHPEFGMVSPAVFIPLAESSGLISGIGEWVIRTACRQNKAWQDMGLPGLRIAVNLSVHQFRNLGFVEMVRGILHETGLSPEFFEVEVTESAALNESDFIIGILNKLKASGISISIDDFGTEYSSLSRLKVLPADRIKIDMQFVRGLDSNVKDQAISNVIISLGKSLGLKVIAEGVETPTQLEFLKQHACDEVQGYYYYKPMPADEIEQILRNIHKI